MSEQTKIKVKRREKAAILKSLQAGLVPKQGLHLIQVGRKTEIEALLKDIEHISDGGGSFRIAVGRFGSGKSFFLNLVRNVALKQGLLVAQADFTTERRLYARGGEAKALYSELIRNLASQSQPDGGALESVCEGWLSETGYRIKSAGGTDEDVLVELGKNLRALEGLVGGFEFAEVLRHFQRSHVEGNERGKSCAIRWLRAEYPTKTEARNDLGVRRIIDDESFYSSLNLMAAFSRLAGYKGMLVICDEMVVLSHRLPSSRSRTANYEALLSILNDTVQGNATGIGFVFGGTDECLEDRRRGLFSYEALRSRLVENQFANEDFVDLSGPVVRLQPLSPEDLFVLLRNIALVHAGGDPAKIAVPDEAIAATLRGASEQLGAEYFRTPRDIIRSFVGLLNILESNENATWQKVLQSDGAFVKADPSLSVEEEILQKGATPDLESEDESENDLTSFRL